MSQSVITVFEDKKMKVNLTNSQIDDILSFRSIMGSQRINIDYDGALQVMHYVGFISKGNTRLQILPKIYDKVHIDNEVEKRASMQVLLNLLRISEFNKVLLLPEQSSMAVESDLLETFISLFADKIFKTYSKQMNREYIEIEENSPFIRGKIDFDQNIKQNPLRKDRHVICYQSFEHDNLINNVIKTVAIRLLTISESAENKMNLKRALTFLDDAQVIPLSKQVINSAKFTRLNNTFKPVFELAKMFFLNLTSESYDGDSTVCSFLVPVNELYEYYLFKVLDGIGDDYHAKYQNNQPFAINQDGKNMLAIRPDILLCKDKQLVTIVDAKYKNPKYVNGIYTNVSQSDIYQVFTYARAYGIKQVALIYPLFDEEKLPWNIIKLRDVESEISLIVGCVDIKNTSVEENQKYLKGILLEKCEDVSKKSVFKCKG